MFKATFFLKALKFNYPNNRKLKEDLLKGDL